MWRKFRHDSEEDTEFAFNNDIAVDFDLSLFMKDEEDVETALREIKQNFKMFQTLYVEGLARTY